MPLCMTSNAIKVQTTYDVQDEVSLSIKQESPRVLDHSPESWHMRCCFGCGYRDSFIFF